MTGADFTGKSYAGGAVPPLFSLVVLMAAL